MFVRTGPATNFPAYGIAPAGATGWVIGVSEDGLWWVVRLNPANVGAGYGWVMAEYTQASNVESVQTIQNPDTYASIPPAPPPSGGPAAMAVDYVNVRTGPGTNYPVLGVAPPGAAASRQRKERGRRLVAGGDPHPVFIQRLWLGICRLCGHAEHGKRAGSRCASPASHRGDNPTPTGCKR